MLAKVAGCSALLSVMSSRHEAFDPKPWICSVAGHFQQTCRVNRSRVQTPAVQLRWSRWPSGLTLWTLWTLCLTAVQGVQGLTSTAPAYRPRVPLLPRGKTTISRFLQTEGRQKEMKGRTANAKKVPYVLCRIALAVASSQGASITRVSAEIMPSTCMACNPMRIIVTMIPRAVLPFVPANLFICSPSC